LRNAGREYWFDSGFVDHGDPWQTHRVHAVAPPLGARLRPFAPKIARMLSQGSDEREIASRLGISRSDVESIFRHLQHVGADRVRSRAAGT
jgi:hypothetical protein